MKALKGIAITAVLVAFIGCDDDWIMDLEPPYGGYIWRVANGSSGYFSFGRITKYNPVDGSYVESYSTPFRGGEEGYPPSYTGYGYNYDAAAGDGRVWVCGEKVFDGLPYTYIWEVGGDDFSTYYGYGLTYDGGYLWASGHGWYNGDYYNEFYRVDPDTYEEELMFIYDSGEIGPKGLAWDGNYLWSVGIQSKGTYHDICLYQYDVGKNVEIRRVRIDFLKGPDNPRGLTYDGEAFWLTTYRDGSNKIYRISPINGRSLGYIVPYWVDPVTGEENIIDKPFAVAYEAPSGSNR